MTMLRIEIKGVEFNNKGAELMLLSIIQALEAHFNEYQLILSPGHLLPYEKRAKLGAWQKFSFSLFGVDWTWLGNLAPGPLKKMLRHFGIVVEQDIDLVLDASGFVYSDKWGAHKMKETLRQLTRMEKTDQKYIFLPQAFGPFTGKNIQLMQQIMAKSELVITRDQHSFNLLSPLAKTSEVYCFPDFTPLLTVDSTFLIDNLPNKYVSIMPNYKMFSKKSEIDKRCYMQFLSRVVKVIETCGLTPILLNHEGKEDYDICLAVAASHKNELVILNQLGALQIKKVLKESVFCVSSRFHGCVSSLSQGVPALATSWSHKYEELYRSYQCEDFILDIGISETQLLKQVESVILNREQHCTKLLQLSQVHKNQCRAMWQLIFDKI